MEQKYKILLSNTFVLAIGNAVIKLLAFILMPLYTAVLTTEEYGMAELLNNLIEIALPIVTLCIVEALFRFSIDSSCDCSELFRNGIFVVLIGDIFLCIICKIIDRFTVAPYMNYFILLYIANSVYKLFAQLARGLGEIKKFTCAGVINAGVLIFCNYIFLVKFGGGVEGYLVSYIIAYFIASIYVFFSAKEYRLIKFGKINLELLKSMLAYGIPNSINMLGWWINNVSDRYILLFFYGTGTAGLYTAAAKLPAMLNLFATIFQQAWEYSSSKEIEEHNGSTFFTNVFIIYSTFCIMVCAFLNFLIPFISKIVLQGEFYAAWRYVPLLLFAATLGCFSTYLGTFYCAIKKTRMAMLSTLAGTSVNIVLNFILIPRIGIFGAIYSTVICYLIIVIIRIIDTRKHISYELNVSLFTLELIIIFLESLGMSYLNIKKAMALSAICIVLLIILNLKLEKKFWKLIKERR